MKNCITYFLKVSKSLNKLLLVKFLIIKQIYFKEFNRIMCVEYVRNNYKINLLFLIVI